MKRNTLLAVGLVLSILAAIYFVTQTTASPPAVKGTIVAIDPPEQGIQVINDESKDWYHCSPRTRITLDDLPAVFQQLAVGQGVLVEFDMSTHEATRIIARNDDRLPAQR